MQLRSVAAEDLNLSVNQYLDFEIIITKQFNLLGSLNNKLTPKL
jgi:hypothetical protein